MSPPLPEREAAIQAAAALVIAPGGWFRKDRTLGSTAPSEVSMLAAVWLQARAVRRESWVRSQEMTERELVQLAATDTSPSFAVPERSFQRVDAPERAVHARCSNCSVRPGFGPCPRCIGTGRVPQRQSNDEEVWVACDCDGGFVRCTLCGGSQHVVRADVRVVTDRLVSLDRLVLPTRAATATSALERVAMPVPSPEFACTLENTPIESAYRGTASMTTPSFFEFELLDASERASKQVAQLRMQFSTLRIESFAVAFVLLRYGEDSDAPCAVVCLQHGERYVAALV